MTLTSLIFSAIAGPHLFSLAEHRSYENLADRLFSLKTGKWLIKYHSRYEAVIMKSEVKIMEGKNLLQEELNIKELGVKGRGLSKYQTRTDTWHHMWTDKQGGYFDFIGSFTPDGESFETSITKSCGEKISQRLYFNSMIARPELCHLLIYDTEKCCWKNAAKVECKKLK